MTEYRIIRVEERPTDNYGFDARELKHEEMRGRVESSDPEEVERSLAQARGIPAVTAADQAPQPAVVEPKDYRDREEVVITRRVLQERRFLGRIGWKNVSTLDSNYRTS